MSAPYILQELVSDIVHTYPDARIDFAPLPSGVCILATSLHGRDFELDYNPKRSTGVSENFQDTPPFIGHDEVFDTLEAGIVRFKSFLADAVQTAAPCEAYVLNDKPLSQ